MGVFADARQVYDCIGGLFRKGQSHEGMGPKIRNSRLIVRFTYSDPDAELTVDAKSEPPEGQYFRVIEGPNDLKPDVLMTMAADVAHQFWLGKLNLLVALNRGLMKAQGPIQDILKLLPAIKPAYEMYPKHLEEIGFGDLARR